jgi:hypothetical protein
VFGKKKDDSKPEPAWKAKKRALAAKQKADAEKAKAKAKADKAAAKAAAKAAKNKEPAWKAKQRALEEQKARDSERSKTRSAKAAAKDAAISARQQRAAAEKKRILDAQKDPFSQSLGVQEEGIVSKISGMFMAAVLDDDDEKKEKERATTLAQKQAAAKKALEAQDLEAIEAAKARKRVIFLMALSVLLAATVVYAVSSLNVAPHSSRALGYYSLASLTVDGELQVSKGLLDVTEGNFHLRLFKETEDKPSFLQNSAWEEDGIYLRATNKSWAWIFSFRAGGQIQLEAKQGDQVFKVILTPRPAPKQ